MDQAQHNNIIEAHNMKKQADKLLLDMHTFSVLNKVGTLINRLSNSQITDEYLAQYQQVSDAENPRQELEAKRQDQLRKLNEALENLTALNNNLRAYSSLEQHSTDEAEVTRETRQRNTILQSAEAAQTLLNEVIADFAFPEDDTSLIEAAWVSKIATNRFGQPVVGSLDLDTEEYRAAEQDNRVIVVPSAHHREEPKAPEEPEEPKEPAKPESKGFFNDVFNEMANGVAGMANNFKKKVVGLVGGAAQAVAEAKDYVVYGNGTEDLSRLSLFPHDPSPEDVRQGDIGNCYLHTVLNMVAKQAPNLIRECMKESPDGKSVTCRFFKPRELLSTEPQKPIYVTVPKEQIIREDARRGSRGALWTIVLETAFANSGLGKEVNAELLQKDAKNAVLGSMSGGSITGFAEMLLGNQVEKSQAVRVKTVKTDENGKIDKTEMEKQMKEMHDLLEGGGILGCAHPKSGAPEGAMTGNGVYYNHAYGVMGIDMAKKEITLRNPHNVAEDKGAEFTMSFDEFSSTFTEFHGSKVKDVYRERDHQTVKDNYKKIVDKLDAALRAQDNIFLRLFKNSDEFNNLRHSITELKTALNSNTATVQEIQKHMETAMKNAASYKTHTTGKEANATRQNRMAIADAIIALHETMSVDALTDPAEPYKSRLKGVVAQKLATAFNQKMKVPEAQGKKKEDFLNTPSFAALFSTTEQLEDAAYSTSTTNLMDKIQKELQKSNQQIEPAKQKEAPVKQASVKGDGPKMGGPN